MTVATGTAVNPAENSDFEMLEVALIDVPVGRREVQENRVAELKGSIVEVGLLQPLIVTPEYRLIGGKHRLTAVKELGWIHVPCIIKSYDDIDAELAEIDENIVRAELSAMERVGQLDRRKTLYELKYPETKRGGYSNVAKGRQEIKTREPGSDDRDGYEGSGEPAEVTTHKSFLDDTADKTGRGRSTILEELKLARVLAEKLPQDVRDIIARTSVADNKTQLQELTEYDSDTQLEIAQKIEEYENLPENKNGRNPKTMSVIEAFRQISGETAFGGVGGENTAAARYLKTMQKCDRLCQQLLDKGDLEAVLTIWTNEMKVDARESAQNVRDYMDKIVELISDDLDAAH